MSWMRRLILQTGKTSLRMGECVCDVRYLFSSNNNGEIGGLSGGMCSTESCCITEASASVDSQAAACGNDSRHPAE